MQKSQQRLLSPVFSRLWCGLYFLFPYYWLQAQIWTYLHISIQKYNKYNTWLTTFSRLIRLVHAVFLFVAHFLHADTLPCLALKHGGPFACFYWKEGQVVSLHCNPNILGRKKEGVSMYENQSPMWQPSSSLRSMQSCFPSHWKVPAIQVPSKHWNWSSVQLEWPITVRGAHLRLDTYGRIDRNGKKLVRRQKIGTEIISIDAWVSFTDAVCMQTSYNTTVRVS